jgi:hypothetical protein
MTAKSRPREPRPAFVPLWPDAGEELGLTRHTTYKAAKLGQIPTKDFGRLKKVATAVLDKLKQGQ